MKNVMKYAAMAFVALTFASCVQDLNTEPIDKKSTTGFNQDALFTKIYATLATTGQQGPAGSADVDGADEGVSGFYRVMWELNEFPTDEGWWVWGDAGVGEARLMAWNGENALVKMLYDRFIIVIKYCNHFLSRADQSDTKGQQQAAEVRFIRALNYWYMLDMFKFAPFQDQESFDYPDFKSRPELYAWLEKELKELTTALPATRLQLYRVDQTAAWLLLGRLYLNAEVYTGTAQWQKALDAAEHALAGQYTLHRTPKTNKEGITYTAYQQLFMGDNDKNGAQKEAVLLVYQDGYYCQTYCGAQFVIASTRTGGMTPWGCSANWTCFRSSPTLVYKFIDQHTASDIKANEYEMPAIAHDDRAILCSYVGGKEPKQWKLSGGMKDGSDAFMDSWACPKFTALYSTTDSLHLVSGAHSEWADTDVPFMRIAEAHLTKAEAMFRLGDAAGATTEINNSVRDRANAKKFTSPISEEELCNEWCREFWGEGRRRTDLIRFNRFAGDGATNNKYQWEGRAGSASFKPMPEKYNWFPIPSDDKKVNPNFKTQVLELSTNKYANEGGDGYTYAN